MTSKQWASSRINIESIQFEWKIENFSYQPQRCGESITSPTFYSGKNKEEEWQLQAFLNGDSNYGENRFTIYLVLKACSKPFLKVTYTLSAINPSNKTALCKIVKSDQLKVDSRSLASHGFLPRSPLLEKNENYLMNDALTICCEIAISRDVSMVSSVNAAEAQLTSVPIEHNLGRDLERLFTELDDGDVFLSVGDEKFPAHKVILTARSPVFTAMFSNKTNLENQKNEVEIKDLTPDVVKHMLKYIYTDKIDDDALAFELLGAAEKYQLEGLKAKCALLIMNDLHHQNAIDSLYYANLYGPAELKKYIIDYICDHELEVEQSSDFVALASDSKTWSELLVEVYVARIAKRRDELKVEI